MSDEATHGPRQAPRFGRAFRDAIIDARLSNDLDDKKARALLDLLAGKQPDSPESADVYRKSLQWSLLLAGTILTLMGLAWMTLFLVTEV